MRESHLTRSMISLRVKKEIEDEFIWEIQMILYNLLVYKTNKKEMGIRNMNFMTDFLQNADPP